MLINMDNPLFNFSLICYYYNAYISFETTYIFIYADNLTMWASKSNQRSCQCQNETEVLFTLIQHNQNNTDGLKKRIKELLINFPLFNIRDSRNKEEIQNLLEYWIGILSVNIKLYKCWTNWDRLSPTRCMIRINGLEREYGVQKVSDFWLLSF